MSVKDPTERFLMTVPKPIYDHLSEQAEKLGVSVQDRIRVILEEEKKKRSKYWIKPPSMGKTETIEEVGAKLENDCYQIGKKIYDEFAIERKRLTIIQMPSHDDKEFWEEHDQDGSLVLPVIQKSFQPLLDDKLYEYDISKAAKQVAEMENKLLSVCEDGDKLFEALPFKCGVRFKDGKWRGWCRVCLNSEKTPTMADAIRVTS